MQQCQFNSRFKESLNELAKSNSTKEKSCLHNKNKDIRTNTPWY